MNERDYHRLVTLLERQTELLEEILRRLPPPTYLQPVVVEVKPVTPP
jgi:hypothetical protein